MRIRSWLSGLLVLAILGTMPMAAGADDRSRRDQANLPGEGFDQPIDVVADGPSFDVPDRPGDRLPDRLHDRVVDRQVDRVSDHVTDRCHIRRFALTNDRCIDDHFPRDISIRKLIYRLVHAGEWNKLLRLLHYLGWI